MSCNDCTWNVQGTFMILIQHNLNRVLFTSSIGKSGVQMQIKGDIHHLVNRKNPSIYK